MIERVILLRCTERSQASVAEVAERILGLLRGLPEVASAAVDRPGDPATQAEWDLRVTVRFADEAALATYAEDPVHSAFVASYLFPRTDARKAWTFRTGA
ncbi:MAG: Dabb family protein [Deltaproteobacteria bacterium]|nr:Dabb family protein [Deltaproteobacteria bacterium]